MGNDMSFRIRETSIYILASAFCNYITLDKELLGYYKPYFNHVCIVNNSIHKCYSGEKIINVCVCVCMLTPNNLKHSKMKVQQLLFLHYYIYKKYFLRERNILIFSHIEHARYASCAENEMDMYAKNADKIKIQTSN